MVLMGPFQLSLFCDFMILKCALSRSTNLSMACVKGEGPASHWHPHRLRAPWDFQAIVWHLPSMPLRLVVLAATSFLLFAPCLPRLPLVGSWGRPRSPGSDNCILLGGCAWRRVRSRCDTCAVLYSSFSAAAFHAVLDALRAVQRWKGFLCREV